MRAGSGAYDGRITTDAAAAFAAGFATGVGVPGMKPRPPTLVPFWKPPNNWDKIISSTIRIKSHSSHRPARDRGHTRRHRRPV